MMRYILVFVLMSSMFTDVAEARRRRRRRAKPSVFSVSTQFRYYNDILQREGNVPLELGPDLSLNFEFKVHRIFSILLIGGQSLDQFRTFAGAGLRVNLPGVFFFGGNLAEIALQKRRKGLLTYTSFTALVNDVQNQDLNIVANRYALGMDISLNPTVFLNIEPSLYSFGGNQFFSAALGLGMEF